MRHNCVLFAISLAACASPPQTPSHVLDLSGPRNDAYRAASEQYGVPLDWLVAIGYQQGRFEPAGEVDDTDDPSMAQAPMDAADPVATLDADTPVDEVDPTPDDSSDPSGSDQPARGWGIMYLTDDQIPHAAELAHRDSEAVRTDVDANIFGAAAWIADAARGSDLRTATTAFLEVEGDSAVLALHDLDAALATGFDVTTEDGERVALVGNGDPIVQDPDTADTDEPSVIGTAERLAPGHYPATQWIPSPNHSSRLGSPIRYVIIHDMEGTMPTAISIFKNAAHQTSAHYLVRSRDGHIVKMVLESQDAWHAGHGWFNRHSIGIEHEGFAFKKKGGGYYTTTLYEASARLTCAIAHRNHIPVDRKHIFGHMNVPSSLSSHTLCSDARGIAGHCGGVSHHADPGRYWDWHVYMHDVATCVMAAQ